MLYLTTTLEEKRAQFQESEYSIRMDICGLRESHFKSVRKKKGKFTIALTKDNVISLRNILMGYSNYDSFRTREKRIIVSFLLIGDTLQAEIILPPTFISYELDKKETEIFLDRLENLYWECVKS